MKKVFTLLSVVLNLGLCIFANAQGFTVVDTVRIYAPLVSTSVPDNLVNSGTTAHPITIKWRVINTDFPSDWIDNGLGTSSTAFCDNSGCYPTSDDINGNTQTSSYTGTTPDFHMQINLAGATSKNCTHYITIKFMNNNDTTLPLYETYVVTYSTASVPTVKSADEMLLYPNPATSSVNIVYDQSLDVKNIAIYNIIGKLITIYKTNSNSSANLNIENMSSGIYFIRLISSQGEVVATRKFTKQ